MNRWFFGLLVLFAGVVGLLNNFNLIDISLGTLFSDFWPVLLIIWGLSIIITAKCYFFGIILAGLGAMFLGQNLHFFTVNFSWLWGIFWPAIIILVGLRILFTNRLGETKTAVMGSIEKKSSRWRLESGNYLAFMGGIELDLGYADIPDGVTRLELTAIMGGIELKIPPELAVVCQGTAFLGGLSLIGKESGGVIASLKAEQGDIQNSAKSLTIHCTTFMGGVEIKN